MLCTGMMLSRVPRANNPSPALSQVETPPPTETDPDWRVELHFSSGDFIGIGFGRTLRDAVRMAINDSLKKGLRHDAP